MGVWIFSIVLTTLASVLAIRVDDNRPQFLIVSAPQGNQRTTEEDTEINSDDQQTQGLQTSSFYHLQKDNYDGSYVNPNFEYKIYHSSDENRFPEKLPSNSYFLGYTMNSPFSKKTSYLSIPEEGVSVRNQEEKSNTVDQVEANHEPGSHILPKYINVSPKYTLTDLATTARNTYMKILESNKAFYETQSPDYATNINYQPVQSKTIKKYYLPTMKYLMVKTHQPENRQQLNQDFMNKEDTKPQPSQQYEVHQTYPDDYPEKDSGSEHHSFHPEVKKKKKEIHYHQHKHLHEHDHDQKHSHKHQSGHHHDHGHEHTNKHAHSHSHKDDHWHDHHEKNEHHHESHHNHGHHSYHDHKHGEDHAHKHHNDHHHGHESHHDHHEDHWNKHSHKHHSDHSHHHDHKHNGKHSHHHHQKHGHKHHYYHHGKY